MRGKEYFCVLLCAVFYPRASGNAPNFSTLAFISTPQKAVEFVSCQGCHCLRLREPRSLSPLVTRLLILQSPSLADIVRLQCLCVCVFGGCVVIGSCSAVWDSAGWRLHVNPSFLSGMFSLSLNWELSVSHSWGTCLHKITLRLLRPEWGECKISFRVSEAVSAIQLLLCFL